MRLEWAVSKPLWQPEQVHSGWEAEWIPHWEGQKGLLSPHLTTTGKERTAMLIYWPLAVCLALFDSLYSLSFFLSFFLEPPSVVTVQHRLTANSISPGLKQSWRIRPQLMTVSGWFSLLVSSAGAKLVHLTSVSYSKSDYSSNQSTGHKFTSQVIEKRWKRCFSSTLLRPSRKWQTTWMTKMFLLCSSNSFE